MLLSAKSRRRISLNARRKKGETDKTKRLTAKEQPECSPPNLTLDKIQALITRLFVHMQCDCNVGSFTKGGMARRIVALAEVVDVVKVANDHQRRARWIVRRHRHETRRILKPLGELTDLVSLHRQVRTWNLNESRGNGAADQCEEQGVPLLSLLAEPFIKAKYTRQ